MMVRALTATFGQFAQISNLIFRHASYFVMSRTFDNILSSGFLKVWSIEYE
jgi:hypothetical protein